jgi:transcriptional regulator with XRE-family HTH domain
MTQDDVARAADISMSTLQRVLRGQEPLPKTARAIEGALDWDSGSLRHLFDGGDPIASTAPADDVADDEMSLEELRETVDQLGAAVEKMRAQLARMEAQRGRSATNRTNRAAR